VATLPPARAEVDTRGTVEVEAVMTAPQEPRTEGTHADHSRSGDDIAEAIEVAEAGSQVEELHDRGTENTTGQAPVEQTYGDPEMTEGQVVLGAGEGGRHPDPDDPAMGTSGGAQSVQGARPVDET
jgi:hypothetical protein